MLTNKIRYPILFQGRNKTREYFEGWYYKQVSQDEKTVISFIPGISIVKDDAHSFIQYIYSSLDEKNEKIIKTGYFKYPLGDLICNDNPFMIQIANSTFTESEISVNLKDQHINVEGTLKLGALVPIKRCILMPNIMGFFAYLPKMECYHGIVSMNHILHGSLRVNNQEVDFNDGKGYIEKDWGTSFPKRYMWIQCNNFKNTNTSVFCSAADIPFMKRSFRGFICNLVIDEKEYRFATYNNSKLKIESVTDRKIALSFENKVAKLKIEASLEHTGELISPQQGKMQGIVKEGLSGKVKICLYNTQNEIIYEDAGTMAGIENLGF